jgi:hypothetical protein
MDTTDIRPFFINKQIPTANIYLCVVTTMDNECKASHAMVNEAEILVYRNKLNTSSRV